MALSSDKVEMLLISGKELNDNDKVMIMTRLRKMTLKQLKLLAKKLNIMLTATSKKMLWIECFLWHILGLSVNKEAQKVMI